MRITPITSEEANEQSVGEPWPSGEYDFMVNEATETISQAGNEQIKLVLHVFNRQGQQRIVFDYLSSASKSQWKVRHFAEAVGMVRQYETGDMPVLDMLSRPGRLKLRVKPAEGQYSAQNAVNDYIPQTSSSAIKVPSLPMDTKTPARAGGGGSRDIDDEIPFSPCVQ